MTITIGLVVEGKDDFKAIEGAICGEFARHSLPMPNFRRLQPENDATGQTDRGGWSKVVGWLIANEGARVDTYFRAVFENDTPCDLVVIHLDSDIHGECLRLAKIAYDSSNLGVVELVNLMRSAISFWLKPDAAREPFFAYAVPVHKTENWLLASIPECEDEVWTSEDAKKLLRAQFDQTRHRSVAAMIDSIVNRIANDNSFLLGRAKSYQLFVEHLNASKWASS